MWWVPIATGFGFAAVVLILHVWQRNRQVDGARVYRARFVQLVSQLDNTANQAHILGSQMIRVFDERLLEYFENTLKIFETLLGAIAQLPPFGEEPAHLGSAFFLARDCQKRLERTQEAVRNALSGKDIIWDDLYLSDSKGPGSLSVRGCFFCSRPYIAERFTHVKAKIDGNIREVVSCNICKEELEKTKKVKVLYFMRDDKPVHWMDVADYQPSEDYWDINQRGGIRKTKHLELVYSAPSVKLSPNRKESSD